MNAYTAKQLGSMLHKTVTFQRSQNRKPSYPELKVQWIRETSVAIINFVEEESKRFNALHPDQQLKNHDIVSVLQTALNVILKALRY